MSNAYPPCHCLLDSAGYLGLVELLVCRRCQIARRLPGQPGHPNELRKSLVSRPNSTRRVLNAHPRDTNGRESPAVRFFVARRSVADAYPSPYGRPNLGRRRTIPPNSLIHESAYQRGGDYARHLPPMRSQQAEQGFFGGSRHRRDVSCNVSALTRLPWPCALLLARKLAALAIGSFPRGKHARRRP